MNVFIIDGGINSLLTSVFYAFENKVLPEAIFIKNCDRQQGLCDNVFEIKTDNEKAERISKVLIEYGGYDAILSAKTCLCSCDFNAPIFAFRFIYKTIYLKKNIFGNLTDKTVSDFVYTEKKVWTEAHRIKGFLRFSESRGGIIYARFSPDNDIIELISPHFLKRLSGISFVIHDVKRGKLAISNGFSLLYESTTLPSSFVPSERETKFEELFRTYYKEINIETRKNLKQQDNFMPRRYRKFMPETYE